MTDAEIKKALECCMDEMGCKKGCPFFDPKAKGAPCIIAKKNKLEKLALDLINRQQEMIDALIAGQETLQKALAEKNAEIERLQKETERFADIGKMYSEIKAEAIKEFAERVKMAFYYEFDEIIPSIMADKIDNLVKEMVGEQG